MRSRWSEYRSAFALLAGERRWMTEVGALGCCLGLPLAISNGSVEATLLLTLLTGFVLLWLASIYYGAKFWRRAQRTGLLDHLSSTVIVDGPVLYRLVWVLPLLGLSQWATLTIPKVLTPAVDALGFFLLGSCFLPYLIQWTTVWMKTGAPLSALGLCLALAGLGMLHWALVLGWFVWLRCWSAPRLTRIRFVSDGLLQAEPPADPTA